MLNGVGWPDVQPGLFGVGEPPSTLWQALLDIGPRLGLVAVDDGIALRAPESTSAESDDLLRGWQRLARERQLVAIAGAAFLAEEVEDSMLAEDLVIGVARLRLQGGELDFRVTVSGARRPTEHLVAQGFPDRLRVERLPDGPALTDRPVQPEKVAPSSHTNSCAGLRKIPTVAPPLKNDRGRPT